MSAPSHRYFDDCGQEVLRQTYYEGLVLIAQERQKEFPWWSLARRRWRRAEREYRKSVGNPVGNGERNRRSEA